MANKNSKVTKVNKNKKKQSGFSVFLSGLFYWIRSWFNNDRCIEAREKNGFIALGIGLASIILASLPILTTRMSTDAGTILDTPTYNLENSLMIFQDEASEAGVQIKISNNSLASVENFDSIATNVTSSGTVYYWAHSYTTEKPIIEDESSSSTSEDSSSGSESTSGASIQGAVVTKEITVYDLLVFRAPSTQTVSEFASSVLTTANDPNTWYESTQSIFATNAIIIGEQGIYIYKATANLTSATTLLLTYDAPLYQGKNLIALIDDLIEEQLPVGSEYTIAEYSSAVVSAYKQVIVAGYETTKVSSAWAYTGVAAVIDLAMVLIFGLTIFLMTRGKNNPFRDYTFLQCYKIIGWASFSPALLSLFAFMPAIGGSSIGLLLFVLLLGVRTMWISMKNLRPTYE